MAARGRSAVAEVTAEDAAGFLAGLREGDQDHAPLAASSAARAVAAVRGLHAFAVAEGMAAADVAACLRPPAPPRRLPRSGRPRQRAGCPARSGSPRWSG